MLVKILINFLGSLSFLFFFWRRLREDYSGTQIFTTAFYILIGVFLFFAISFNFISPWWFWLSLLGGFLGLILGIFRYKLRFFEVLETFLTAFFPWLTLIFLSDSILKLNLISLVFSVLILGLIGVFYYLDDHYKGFVWYRSGRIGFAGLTTAGLFFLIRMVIATFFPFVISFSGKSDIFLSGIGAFILFLLTYHLARSET
jgi:hypothetical protein